MKTYNQFILEIIKSVEDMKNLSGDDIIKGMDIIDKTSTGGTRKLRRRNFLKDLTGLDTPWYQ